MVLRISKQCIQAVASATMRRVEACEAGEMISSRRKVVDCSHCIPRPNALIVASAVTVEPPRTSVQNWRASCQWLRAPALVMRSTGFSSSFEGSPAFKSDAFFFANFAKLRLFLKILSLSGNIQPTSSQDGSCPSNALQSLTGSWTTS